MPRLY